jgi:uncharacterized membrane protein
VDAGLDLAWKIPLLQHQQQQQRLGGYNYRYCHYVQLDGRLPLLALIAGKEGWVVALVVVFVVVLVVVVATTTWIVAATRTFVKRGTTVDEAEWILESRRHKQH